jgi:cytidylate kinase
LNLVKQKVNESGDVENISSGKAVYDRNFNKLQTFSIIVSGWPAVGKTTVAAELADEFGMKVYNGGDILKQIATKMGYRTSGNDWWDSVEGRQFMEKRKSDPTSDRVVDNKLKEIIKGGNAVITSYTLPWLVKDKCIKLWLQGSAKNRARRMATRDKINFAEATEIVKERDYQNRRIYEDLYGFEFGKDLSVFDFSLNTDMMDLSSLVQISKEIVRKVKPCAD